VQKYTFFWIRKHLERKKYLIFHIYASLFLKKMYFCSAENDAEIMVKN